MGLLPYEKETHINMSATDDKMRIFTTEKTIMRKLDAYVEESEDWRVVEIGKVNGETVSKIYEAPRKLLMMRKKKPVSHMTEEQRTAAGERLRAFREAKKNGVLPEPDTEEEDFGAEEEQEGSASLDGETSPNAGGSSAAGETPRLEPQKSKPNIVKVKSVIAEMEKGR